MPPSPAPCAQQPHSTAPGCQAGSEHAVPAACSVQGQPSTARSLLGIQFGSWQSSHAKIILLKCVKLRTSLAIKLAVLLHRLFSSIHLGIQLMS